MIVLLTPSMSPQSIRQGSVPERRIVDAWNKYVEEIGAPQETRVSVAEIHNLRDGYYATARLLWSRGSQDVWTMPNIYAVGPDEKLADAALWSRSGWYGTWQTCSKIFGPPASGYGRESWLQICSSNR